MMSWDGNERRSHLTLTEEQIQDIVKRVTERVVSNMYEEVGHSIVKKLSWLIGIVVVGLAVWLTHNDVIKVP